MVQGYDSSSFYGVKTLYDPGTQSQNYGFHSGQPATLRNLNFCHSYTTTPLSAVSSWVSDIQYCYFNLAFITIRSDGHEIRIAQKLLRKDC
jgi:hypothetical protein